MARDLPPIDPSLLARPDPPRLHPPVAGGVLSLPYQQMPWERFEKLIIVLARDVHEATTARLYGERGQAQDGIDIYVDVEGGLVAIQCKRVAVMGPAAITAAVDGFLGGRWHEEADEFIVATSQPLRSTSLDDRFRNESERLARQGKKLVRWDADRLDEILLGRHDVVEQFFGVVWRDAFCLSRPSTRGRKVAGGLTLVVAGIAIVLVLRGASYPTVQQQVANDRRALKAQGYGVSVMEGFALRPGAAPSTVMVAQPKDIARSRDQGFHAQLRIYDQRDSGPPDVFRFEPVADVGRERRDRPTSEQDPSSARAERFTFASSELRTMNVDGSDGDEIVGAVTEIGNEQDTYPRPFVIAWDAPRERYALQALLSPASTSFNTMRPALARPPGPALNYARVLYDDVYLRPTRIRNRADSQILQMYAPQAYVLTSLQPDRSSLGMAGRIRLRAGYAASARSVGTLDELQVIDWVLVVPPDGGAITAYPTPGPGPVDVGVESSRLKRLLQRLP